MVEYLLARMYKALGLTPALSINKGRKLRKKKAEGREERNGLLEVILSVSIIAENFLEVEKVYRKWGIQLSFTL